MMGSKEATERFIALMTGELQKIGDAVPAIAIAVGPDAKIYLMTSLSPELTLGALQTAIEEITEGRFEIESMQRIRKDRLQ